MRFHSGVCRCLLIAALSLLAIETVAEERKIDSKPWLGLYFGAQIPGYVVMKSSPVRISGWQSVDKMLKPDISDPLIEYLAGECKKAPGVGVAVVNIRPSISLGTVPGTSSNPTTNITNGMVKEYEGDCVTDVERLKR